MQNEWGEKREEELGCALLKPLNLSFLSLIFSFAHKKCRIRFLEFRVPPSLTFGFADMPIFGFLEL